MEPSPYIKLESRYRGVSLHSGRFDLCFSFSLIPQKSNRNKVTKLKHSLTSDILNHMLG